jgi:hypothetical protein
MSPEVFLAAGYAALLLAGAVTLEWLSAHTHRRSLRYRTAGFSYHADHDVWECPEGEHLWPHEFDHERRLVRYRAKAHVCNGCPRKASCTDSNHGREVVRPLDPWPHSEAGRFHRGVALVLVVLAALVLVVVGVRHHDATELGTLAAALVVALAIGRWLLRDFRAHPSNFPVGLAVTAADGVRERSRWASQNRTRGTS